jgi:hypothetical protein
VKHLLLLCAIELASTQPVPAPLAQLYADAFRCVGDTPEPASASLTEVNRYFPGRFAVWPVLDVHTDVGQAGAWRRRGIRPGLLLPPSGELRTDGATIRRLKGLQAEGAIPVATLRQATPRALSAERYSWCMNGLCPAAWLLINGVGSELSLLPPGLYLSAPHWHGAPELPLPNRRLRIWGRDVLTLQRVLPEGGGVAAVIDPDSAAPLFDAAPRSQWRWLGQTFVTDSSGTDTSWAGHALLTTGRLAFVLWRTVEPVKLRLPEIALAGLGWLSIGLAGFNVLAILLLVVLRTSTRPNP